MSLLSSFPSTTFSEEPGLGGTEAFYVLVVDTVSQAPQLVNVLLSSILFGASERYLEVVPRFELDTNVVQYQGIATSITLATVYILL